MGLNYTKQVFLFLTLNLVTVRCQTSCHLDLISDSATEVQVNDIPETTPDEGLLWESGTSGIIRAVATPSPHDGYVQGLRYSTRYQYVAALGSNFSNFITTQRTTTIRRDVIYFCDDESQRPLTFFFNLVDENNSPPTFVNDGTLPKIEIIKIDGASGVEPLQHPQILVQDMDFSPENARMVVVSTQGAFLAEAVLDPSVNPERDGYLFNIQMSVDWDRVALGEYNFRLLVTDGKFTADKSLTVDVWPARK